LKKILVIGSSNIDFVVNVQYMPAVGETIIGNALSKIPGGKGANQAYACAKLGGDITFLSTLGDDDSGKLLIDNLSRAGVNTGLISVLKDTPTGMAIIYINKEGNNSIVVVSGANGLCSAEYLKNQSEAFQESDIMIVQMEIPYDSVYYAVEKADKLGKTVILNPAPAPDYIPDEIYSCIDIITPNETELARLTGYGIDSFENIKEGCQALLRKGVKNVLVTLGARGAMLVNNNEASIFAPPDIKVVDTTAAGDTFNAAIAVMLAEGRSYHDAIKFANIASTIAVSRKGAQTSVPARQEVDNFSKQLKNEK